MRICFLTQRIDDAGGIQRVVANIASALAEKNEIEIAVISEHIGRPYYSIPDSVNVVPLHQCLKQKDIWGIARKVTNYLQLDLPSALAKRVFYSKARIDALTEYLNQNNFDCVISVAIENTLLLSLVERNNLNNKKVKFYGWLHNTFDAYFHTIGKYGYGRENLAREILGNLESLVYITETGAKNFSERLGVPCVAIHNPLSYETNQLPTFSNKTLLFVGRLVEQKGLSHLLEIAEKIFANHQYTEWKLVIVGDGEDHSILERGIKEKGLDSHIEMVGDQSDTMSYYLNSDVVLVPSKWEGFGLVVTEAFECGIPVVAFHNEGPDEIITHGKNGYLIGRYDTTSFAEYVMQLMDNSRLKSEMSVEARRRAQDFKLWRIIYQWKELIGLDSRSNPTI